jgi:hypothetical protein
MTTYIPLNETEFAIIDLEDVPKVFEVSLTWSRNSRGYADVKVKKGRKLIACHQMHRVVCEAPAGLVTDHINHDRLDNRSKNLRVVTNSLNQANKLKVRTWGKNPSRFKGLSSKGLGWRVYCKGQYLGYEKDAAMGALLYNVAAYQMFGPSSLLNDLVFEGCTGKLLT